MPKAICKSHRMLLAAAVVVGLSFGPSAPVHALFIDPATGLGWLELSRTIGRTYHTVTAQLGPGGEFAGFRYATSEEVLTLFSSQGVPDIGSSTVANYEPISNLLSQLGVLQEELNYRQSTARTGTAGLDGTSHDMAFLRIDRAVHCGSFCRGVADLTNPYPDTFNGGPSYASWLVQESAGPGTISNPEPASLLLFGSGLAGLLARKKRLTHLS